MITEDYISFKTAKFMKEKGFNELDCEFLGWIGESGKHYSGNDTFYDEKELKEAQKDMKDFIPLITLQTTMKWLREVHKLSIEPYYSEVLTWVVDIKHIDKHTSLSEFEAVRDKNYDSYEKACEATIKYCLENLI